MYLGFVLAALVGFVCLALVLADNTQSRQRDNTCTGFATLGTVCLRFVLGEWAKLVKHTAFMTVVLVNRHLVPPFV